MINCDKCLGLKPSANKLELSSVSDLVMEVSNEEIKYSCNGDDKASGPDGYSAFF